jgi:hypothetical protein
MAAAINVAAEQGRFEMRRVSNEAADNLYRGRS